MRRHRIDPLGPGPRLLLLSGLVLATTGVALFLTVAAPDDSNGADPRSGDTLYRVTETVAPSPTETPATRFTTLIVPRLGLRVPVVKGTDPAALARGVGQWDNDTGPGDKGNYVLAGDADDPFTQVRPGDHVVIETASYRYVYEMATRGDQYPVDATAAWPVSDLPTPVRGGPNRVLTLITDTDTTAGARRWVGFGHLYAIHLRKDPASG